MAKVTIEGCIGCTACTAYPDLFDMDGDVAICVLGDEVDDEFAEDLEAAAAGCPVSAIKVD